MEFDIKTLFYTYSNTKQVLNLTKITVYIALKIKPKTNGRISVVDKSHTKTNTTL